MGQEASSLEQKRRPTIPLPLSLTRSSTTRRSRSASSPLPPPSSPASDLPPELLILILELAVQDLHLQHSADGFRHARSFLCRTSLVAKDWSEVSRELMWRRLKIGSEKMGRLVLKSKAWGKYPVRRLRVGGNTFYGGVSVRTTQKLLAGVVGLRELELNGYDIVGRTLSFNDLSSPGLKDLTSLSLFYTYLNGNHETVSVPFSLTDINLRGYSASACNPYTVFACPTLRSVIIGEYSRSLAVWGGDLDNCHALFCAISSSLSTLNFECDYAELQPVLPLCINLTTLHTRRAGTELAALLSDLDCQLQHLILEPLYLSELVPALSTSLNLPSLSSLLSLEIPSHPRHEFTQIPHGSDVLLTLLQRGVNVVFGSSGSALTATS